MNNVNKGRWQKLLGGGKLSIETPSEELAKQSRYSASAQLEADRLSNILNTINEIGYSIGSSIAGIDFSQLGTPKEGCGGKIKKKESGGIHINPVNKGKFTASANRAGMGVQAFASKVLANKEDYSSTQVKRANFARNASKWRHENGGIVDPLEYELMSRVITQRNKNLNWVERGLNPEGYPKIDNGDGTYSTHKLAYSIGDQGEAYVYPTIIQNDKGELQQLSNQEAWDYALKTKTAIQFPNERLAKYYSENGLINHKKSNGGTLLNRALVEDGETALLPNGKILEFNGREHIKPNNQLYRADGTPDGIPVNLPDGTVIDQKNYDLDENGQLVRTTRNSIAAQRKKLANEELSTLSRLERKFNKTMNKDIPLNKSTLSRLQLTAQKENQRIQTKNQELTNKTIIISKMLNGGQLQKAANGKPPVKDFDIGEMDENTILLEPENSIIINKENPFSRDISDLILPKHIVPKKTQDAINAMQQPKTHFKDLLLDKLKNTSVGNLVNYGALLKSLNKPDYATAAFAQANSISNPYKSISYDVEKGLEDQYQINNMQLQENLRDIDRQLATARRSAALSTNSLQEQRALALSSDVIEGEKRRKAILDKLTVDADITGKLAGAKTQREMLVAQGAADAEMYSKNAVQNYYSQKGVQEDQKVEVIQQIGKALNEAKMNKDTVSQILNNGDLMKALMEAGVTYDQLLQFLGQTEKKEQAKGKGTATTTTQG